MADEQFRQFCRKSSDACLEEILKKEYARYKHGDYHDAEVVAAERGWTVKKGVRQ